MIEVCFQWELLIYVDGADLLSGFLCLFGHEVSVLAT